MITKIKATHTPGPWKVAHSGYANSPFVIYAGMVTPNFHNKFPLSGVNAVAEIFHDESEQHEEQTANAKLIAGAPEMLAALEYLACRLRIEGGTGDPEAAESQTLFRMAEEVEAVIRQVQP